MNPELVKNANPLKSGMYHKGMHHKEKREILIFSTLYNYCKRKKYQLHFCAKFGSEFENYYRQKHVKGDWIFSPKTNLGSSYDLINKSQLIVFTNSTLGLEALAKGKRCISFPPEEFPIENFSKKYPSTGPFWSCDFSHEIMENYLEKIIKYSDEEWDKIVKENIGDIMEYDPKNNGLHSILKKINLQVLTV